MDLYYHFFDRAAYDQIWRLSWTEFRRAWNSGPWTRKPLNEHRGYFGDSLRDLIAFYVDPEPSDQEVDEILTRRTIRWTAIHGAPQSYFLSAIISNVPKLRDRQFALNIFAEGDFVVLLSAAADAYLNRRIQRRTLRAVLALHTLSDLNEMLVLTRAERHAFGDLTRAQPGMFLPIYPLAGVRSFRGGRVVGMPS